MIQVEDVGSDSDGGAGSSEEPEDPQTSGEVREEVGEEDGEEVGEDVGEYVGEDVGEAAECPSTPPPETCAKTPEWIARPSGEHELWEDGQGGTPSPPKSPSKELEFEEKVPKFVLIEDSPISSKTPECPLSQEIALLTKKLADAKRQNMAWNFGLKLLNLGSYFWIKQFVFNVPTARVLFSCVF